ncbi:uncharacterized protein LOC131935041 isoform X2 [Physella acuta]|uniref:uncharacterized protein LOC131935041 isoform X2 n=1 Tax=Physella acuta TaxID=109671 RepID=UPI0027DE665B|nr:uncharacterized protein LOC131935041 isoform X2 [Physella acuta]
MVGIITRSSSLNSFSSICYCFITLTIHAYSCYTAISRYKLAESRAWPGGGGTPSESAILLGLTVLSLMLLPMLCATAFVKVGNLANDGIKLGRDHALGCSLDASQDCSVKHHGVARVWKHFCPIAQTLHIMAAFLLLLPETFLNAVEIKFGYKSTDASWASNIDFMYHPERAYLSEIRSSVNVSHYSNATHVILPTPRVPSEGWSDRMTISITFVNFCFALICFLVRYASVFWYTNKLMTAVFALQLFGMVLNSIFSFNCFSTLYCVCYNKNLFPNVHLSLGCMVDLVLYLIGSTILILSTMTVFEYGSHYFHEKFKIVERHHNPESYIKETLIVNSGCQGYIPHSCAMGALVVFAVCKGPLLYEQVSLMRLTGDQLLLSGIVCEVCYMVLWVALWFGLTIKQQWKFRILDYVPLKQPCQLLSDDCIVKTSQHGFGDHSQTDSLTRSRRLSGRESYPRYCDNGAALTAGTYEDNYHSDICTDDSDLINNAGEVILDLDGNPSATDSGARRQRNRRHGGQRVTFDEKVRSRRSPSKENYTPTSSLTRQGHPAASHRHDDVNHLNIVADIHNTVPSSPTAQGDSDVILRNKPTDNSTLTREYRNSIRSKCGEYYSSSNNLSGFEEAVLGTSPPETLTTLMSSFRDKVRESSIAASTFKERERHMLEQFEYVDPPPPPIIDDLENVETEKRRCIAISDEDIGNLRLENSGMNIPVDPRDTKDVYYRYDDNINDYPKTSSLTRKGKQKSEDGHHNTATSDVNAPPLMEDIHSGKTRVVVVPKDSHHHLNGVNVQQRLK